jgi:hypothetical protein
LAQLIAATDVYTWKVLRRDLGLSRQTTEATLRDLAIKILHNRAGVAGGQAGARPAPER